MNGGRRYAILRRILFDNLTILFVLKEMGYSAVGVWKKEDAKIRNAILIE